MKLPTRTLPTRALQALRCPGRRHARAIAACLVLAPLALHGPALARVEVQWSDWGSGGASGATGTVALPTGGSVDVTFSGTTHQVFTDLLPQPYWGPSTTYTGSAFNNAPPNRDVIMIAGGPGSGTMRPSSHPSSACPARRMHCLAPSPAASSASAAASPS